MAKTKNQTFSYGSSAIPQSENKYSIIRWAFGGLNKKDTIDSGNITDGEGIIVDPPNITSSIAPYKFTTKQETISIFGFKDKLFIIYRESGKIKISCMLKDGTEYTGELGNALGTEEDFKPRTMVQFNVASNTENIVEAEYIRKLLIFPDAYTIDFDISENFTPKYLGETYPSLKYSTVYGSRVFGVDDNLVYASSYNDYANWNLDTAEEYNEANAWVSMSQSNVKADGAFTAIATYDNHVVLFKKDFMQLVYNNKNPFRIVDIGAWGCDNPYAVTESDGVLFFVSQEAVYAFSGGTPKEISGNLNIQSYRGAVLGSYNSTLYLYVDNNIYTYKNGVWSSYGSVGVEIKQFATVDYGIAAITSDNNVYFLDWLEQKYDGTSWEKVYSLSDGRPWWFETDFIALGKLDVRRIKKISILCDLDKDSYVSAYLLKDGEVFDENKTLKLCSSTKSGQTLMRSLIRGTSAYMHRLYVTGKGKAKIHAIELHLSWGGELYVEK